METAICQAQIEPFIIPLYWPVTYKSLLWAAAFLQTIALYCHQWLAAILATAAFIFTLLKHVSQYFPHLGVEDT